MHKIDNDGQVDEKGVLDLTNSELPTLDEVRLIVKVCSQRCI